MFNDVKISVFVDEGKCKEKYEGQPEDIRRRLDELSVENSRLRETIKKIRGLLTL